MKETEADLLRELYNNGKLDQLDNHIGVIIDSKDIKRLEMVLDVFDSRRNDKEFFHLMNDIERYLNK